MARVGELLASGWRRSLLGRATARDGPHPPRPRQGITPPVEQALRQWFPPEPAPAAGLPAPGDRLEDVACPVCGTTATVEAFTDNVRESGYCTACGAWTRLRQLALALAHVARPPGQPLVASLAELAASGGDGLRLFNTEAHGPIHEALRTIPGYVCSEYFGPDFRSGDRHPSGVLHQDLQALSFPPGSFDLVISSDVFEHVADPYTAHREVHRVLAPGGHHVFTVPYDEASPLDVVRARVDAGGSLHHVLPPVYHADPVRPDEGALVFTVFGMEMISSLARLGFSCVVYRPWDPGRGLVGDNTVFVARKH